MEGGQPHQRKSEEENAFHWHIRRSQCIRHHSFVLWGEAWSLLDAAEAESHQSCIYSAAARFAGICGALHYSWMAQGSESWWQTVWEVTEDWRLGCLSEHCVGFEWFWTRQLFDPKLPKIETYGPEMSFKVSMSLQMHMVSNNNIYLLIYVDCYSF